MTALSKTSVAIKKIAVYAVLAGVSGLFGCAAGPNANPRDPLEPLNRSVSKFNDGVDRAVLKPVATAYRDVLPSPVRTGVYNFFGNIKDMWSFVNSVLQLRPTLAIDNAVRVAMNTFFGLGGLIDIAGEFGIERHSQDFGQTLGRWGVPTGPYIVLPLLGPSSVRDTASVLVYSKGDPVWNLKDIDSRNSLYLLRGIDQRAKLLSAGELLDQIALDKYTFTRDAYLQSRDSEIYRGKIQLRESESDNSDAPEK